MTISSISYHPEFLQLNFPLPGTRLYSANRQRAIYSLDDHPDLLLFIELDGIRTDRQDHHGLIPGKGTVCNALAAYAHRRLVSHRIPTTIVAFGPRDLSRYLDDNHAKVLFDRATIRKRMTPLEIQFTFISRMGGLLWDRYREEGRSAFGLNLPPGISVGDRLTPAVLLPQARVFGSHPMDVDGLRLRYPNDCRMTRRAYEIILKHFADHGMDLAAARMSVGTTPAFEVVLSPDFCGPSNAIIYDGDGPDRLDLGFLNSEARKVWNDSGHFPLFFDNATLQKASSNLAVIFRRVTDMTPADYLKNGAA